MSDSPSLSRKTEGSMKGVIIKAPRRLEIKEFNIPKIGRTDLLVKIRASSLCGTDLDIYSGKFKWNYPTRVGHEFSGEVVKTGEDVKLFKKGDRVVGENVIGCGKCPICRTGSYNLCEEVPQLFDAHSEYIISPERSSFKFSERISFEEAALAEPLCVAYRACERAEVKSGTKVCIIGSGGIGLYAVMVCKLKGAIQVIAVDVRPERLKIAKKFGATDIINAEKKKVIPQVLNLTNGRGVDSTIIAVGVKDVLNNAIKITRKGGTLVVLGLYHDKESVIVDYNDIIFRELQVRGNFSSPNVWPKVIKLIEEGRLSPGSLITHRFPLKEAEKAFETGLDKRKQAIKIVLEA